MALPEMRSKPVFTRKSGWVSLSLVLACIAGSSDAGSTPKEPVPVLSASANAAAAPAQFVPTNHWAYDAMTQLAHRGFSTGFPDNTFSGKRPLPRRDFARGIRHLVVGGYLVRQSGIPGYKLDGTALERLLSEFAPDLSAAGADVHALWRGVADLRASAPGSSAPGLRFPLPTGSMRADVELAWSSQTDGFRRGAALAVAEWAQGLVLLYTLDPVADSGDEFPNAIPLVHISPGTGSAERVLGHNTEVWRRLRDQGPPEGTSVSWLRDLFELKRVWSRSELRERKEFKQDWLINPKQEVVAGAQALRLKLGWNCFGPPSCTLEAQTKAGTVTFETPPGSDWGWSSVGGPEVVWGRPGSGVVYLRGRVRGKQRIFAYDLRTGWLLNTAEG